MHEMAIASNLLEQVVRIAEQHNSSAVERVELDVGLLQQVVPDSLMLAFAAAAQDTPAAGAVLELTEVKPVARCRPCDAPFEPSLTDYVCPRCGQADVQIVAGQDIILRSIVLRTKEAAPVP